MTTLSIRQLAALSLAGLSFACTDPPPRGLIIRAGRLLDGTKAPVREKVRIVVRDGVIVAIEPDGGEVSADTETQVIDARDLTVLPGLVDAHTHLAASGACTFGGGVGSGQIARNLGAHLRAGVTTIADLGAPFEAIVAVRRWVGTSRSRGPRVLVAGPMLTAPGGYLTAIAGGALVEAEAVLEVESPVAGRQIVRRLARGDVDLVKVGLQETNFDTTALPLLSEATLCAIVKEAHKQELKVIAHAVGNDSYQRALDCGVDAFAHAPVDPLRDAVWRQLVASGTPVIPTVFPWNAPLAGPTRLDDYRGAAIDDSVREDLEAYAEADAKSGETLPDSLMPGIPRARATAVAATVRTNALRLRDASVPLGFGTDAASCFNPLGAPVREMRMLVASGFTPAQVLGMATQGAAGILGLDQAIGRIAVGYRADIIAVSGRPDATIDDIVGVQHVVLDGVEQNLEAPGVGSAAGVALRVLWESFSK